MKRILLIVAIVLMLPTLASAQCSDGTCRPVAKAVKVSVLVVRKTPAIIVAAPCAVVRVVRKVQPVRRVLRAPFRILRCNR